MPRRRALRVGTYSRPDLPVVDVSTRTAGPAPCVSIVVATYNRSNVLRYTLESLVAQSFTDWEALVIGDHCTDDTEAVVASFGDPRLVWRNLEHNLGEQSGPNSVGARMARGRYLAWLNHDDLWFRDHLDALVSEAETRRADVVASGWLNIGPAPDMAADAAYGVTAEVWNSTVTTTLARSAVYPASTWLMRRELVGRVGDWRPARALRGAPSQDFIYRCWALGAAMRLGGAPSVVAIQSGRFAQSYAERREREHALLAPLVAGGRPGEFAEQVAATVPVVQAPARDRWREARAERRLIGTAAREVTTWAAGPAARLGIGPAELKARFKGVATGQWMADLHAFRGLSR